MEVEGVLSRSKVRTLTWRSRGSAYLQQIRAPPSAHSLTLHWPQATVHSSLVALPWLAWHSMPDETKGERGIASSRVSIHAVRPAVRSGEHRGSQRSMMWLRQMAH